MYLYANKTLIARSSSQIVFLRQELDKNSNLVWKEFHEIDARGFIYYIKGNIRLQIITDDVIYFYLLNTADGVP